MNEAEILILNEREHLLPLKESTASLKIKFNEHDKKVIESILNIQSFAIDLEEVCRKCKMDSVKTDFETYKKILITDLDKLHKKTNSIESIQRLDRWIEALNRIEALLLEYDEKVKTQEEKSKSHDDLKKSHWKKRQKGKTITPKETQKFQQLTKTIEDGAKYIAQMQRDLASRLDVAVVKRSGVFAAIVAPFINTQRSFYSEFNAIMNKLDGIEMSLMAQSQFSIFSKDESKTESKENGAEKKKEETMLSNVKNILKKKVQKMKKSNTEIDEHNGETGIWGNTGSVILTKSKKGDKNKKLKESNANSDSKSVGGFKKSSPKASAGKPPVIGPFDALMNRGGANIPHPGATPSGPIRKSPRRSSMPSTTKIDMASLSLDDSFDPFSDIFAVKPTSTNVANPPNNNQVPANSPVPSMRSTARNRSQTEAQPTLTALDDDFDPFAGF
eukprot:TRINITY_DN7838_c0_g2_i1.p1 TRINITY_DN7838_c0_g2~~TRINITY_DN7838_c0_g2_i1.p1  ORF type:complete len:445 (+),score=122.46 TRINITY_DN7838_c0_g2_i1:130-1464(+)